MRRRSTKSFIHRPAALHLSVAGTAWLVNRASRRVRSKNGANPFLGLAALLCHQTCLSRPRDVCLAKSEVAWHAHLAWARRSLCPYARPAVAQSRFRTDRARGAAAFCENPWQRRNSIGIEAAAHWQPRSLPSLRRSRGSDRAFLRVCGALCEVRGKAAVGVNRAHGAGLAGIRGAAAFCNGDRAANPRRRFFTSTCTHTPSTPACTNRGARSHTKKGRALNARARALTEVRSHTSTHTSTHTGAHRGAHTGAHTGAHKPTRTH